MSTTMNAPNLISIFEELKQEGYVFRGLKNPEYHLMPKAFRPEEIQNMKAKLGVPLSAFKRWLNSPKVEYALQMCLGNAYQTLKSSRVITNLKDFCIFLMSYSHELHLFVQENPGHVSQKDIEMLKLREVEYWKDEETFYHMFSSYLPTIIRRYDLQGKRIDSQEPYEDINCMDETLPQHYGFITAAMDWTYDYKVAMHFAINGHERETCCVYALKILNESRSPIKMMKKSELVRNLRAERQNGLFTYFANPCSFFLIHCQFPSINYYLPWNGHLFELRKVQIERTESNLNYIRKLLADEKITEVYLMPLLTESLVEA